jgi:hypothetical protein
MKTTKTNGAANATARTISYLDATEIDLRLTLGEAAFVLDALFGFPLNLVDAKAIHDKLGKQCHKQTKTTPTAQRRQEDRDRRNRLELAEYNRVMATKKKATA